MGRVGREWEGEKINKIVIRDLVGNWSEIGRLTASSKDEVKLTACLVSGRGLGKGEVKEARRGKRELEIN